MAIRWKQTDYLNLGREVARFNKKINELNKEEKKLYLPEIQNYKDVKNTIHTREQLNSVIRSLRAFSKEGAENVFVTEAGDTITVWEHNQNLRQIRNAERNLRQEAKELEKPTSSGYSKAQMGSLLYREIVAKLRNLRKIEQKSGRDYKRIKQRLNEIGALDYNMVRATIYRENFEYALSFSEKMEGYDLLLRRLNRIKNPINFFNFVRKSDVMSDIFVYYKPGDGLVYGDFSSEQDRFNKGLEELGIVEEEKKNLINRIQKQMNKESFSIQDDVNKRINKQKYNLLLAQAKSINSAEDLFQVLDNIKIAEKILN